MATKIGKNQHVRQNSPMAKTINNKSKMAAKKKMATKIQDGHQNC